jgi:drug/metabolite transporter (DMT)-like permease
MGWRVLLVLVFGGVVTTLANVAHFSAVEIGGLVLTAPVVATLVLWSALFGEIFLKERVGPGMTLGLVAAALGIGILGYSQAAGDEVSSDALLAIPLVLAAAAGWAMGTTTMRYAIQRGVGNNMTVAAGQSGGLLLFVPLLFALGRGHLLWTTETRTVGLFLLVGVFGTTAMVFLAEALSHTTVASTQMFQSTSAVMTMALAVLFLGEKLTWLTVLGTVLMLAGVFYFQWSKARQDALTL